MKPKRSSPPIFLIADSQLLFWSGTEGPFLRRVAGFLPAAPKAAYVGASNGDRPEFFELFADAMATAGIRNCGHITADPNEDERDFFESADLILLAGGDVQRGWRALEKNGLAARLPERRRDGAVLIGLSAGAVQLGLAGLGDDGSPFETARMLPMVVDAHQEPLWHRLHRLVQGVDGHVAGLGIPSGGGAAVLPDMTVEPIRKPLVELVARDGEILKTLLLPPGAGPESEGADPS